MIEPSWAAIKQQKAERGHERWFCSHASNPNPRLYKRYWRLFTRNSEWEGVDFLRKATAVCTYVAEEQVVQLQMADEPVWLYVVRFPRWDPQVMPWDLSHDRWLGVVDWAPAFDDDADPLTDDGER